MGTKPALLRLRRAVLVEIIQPRLAQRDDLGMFCQLDQFVRRNAVFFVGMMRMGADRAIDVRESLGDGEQPVEPPHPGRDGDDAADAGGLGARDGGAEIVGLLKTGSAFYAPASSAIAMARLRAMIGEGSRRASWS